MSVAARSYYFSKCPRSDEITGSLVPSAGPLRGWMRGGPEPQKPAPIMPQDEQTIEKPERNRRHHEQVHRGDAVWMVAQKRSPALRRGPPPPRHVLGHTRLPDIDAEFEQLAMDPRSSPQRIGKAHVADQLADIKRPIEGRISIRPLSRAAS